MGTLKDSSLSEQLSTFFKRGGEKWTNLGQDCQDRSVSGFFSTDEAEGIRDTLGADSHGGLTCIRAPQADFGAAVAELDDA